jgi:glycosyltransferase involved in cell wall biosynthesis
MTIDGTKVCMLVLNQVTRDARVLKEADSLARFGCLVTIIGVRGLDQVDSYVKLPNGVEVYRVDHFHGQSWRRFLPTLRLRYHLLIVVLILTIAAWACVSLSYEMALGFVALLSLISIPFVARFLMRLPIPFKELVNRLRIIRNYGHAANRVLHRLNPDVVHCHDLNTLPAGTKFKKTHPTVKCIYDSHEIYEEQALLQLGESFVYRLLQRRLSKRLDGFITVNDEIARFLSLRYPRLPEPVVVMNASPLCSAGVTYDGRLHSAAGLTRDTNILLFHGGFAKHRGLTNLVRCAPFLPKGWAVVLMGWGALEGELRAIKRLERLKNVLFVLPAPVSDLSLWAAGGSIGIIPYDNASLNHYYCSPNKLWEYAAAGVPILASPRPVLKHMISTHGIGWLLRDPITPEGIGSVIEKISSEEIARKRQNCSEFVRKENWGKYEKNLLGLYRNLGARAQ